MGLADAFVGVRADAGPAKHSAAALAIKAGIFFIIGVTTPAIKRPTLTARLLQNKLAGEESQAESRSREALASAPGACENRRS